MGVEGSRVAIVGGSIAGCAAAIALRRAGCDVTVYERSHHLKDRGSGIVIPVPLRDQLVSEHYLGTDMPACPCSERTWVVRHGNARYGRVIARQPMPAVMNNWGVLWRTLRSRVPDEAYREGMAIADVEADARGATVVLGDGTRQRFDVLVGADGYRSKVRGLVHPRSQPAYAGYVLWRGNYEESRLPPGLPSDADSAVLTIGFPGGHAILYVIPDFDRACALGQRRMNWAVYTGTPDGLRFDDPESVPPGCVGEDLVAFFEDVLEEHLPPYWAEVVRRTGIDELSIQPIYDEALPTYVSQRVMLVGDASTVTRPHTASGATKALQDALALERACQEHTGWEDVLAAYDTERCAVGNDLVELGRRIGRAQVEETPDWGSLTTAEFEAWVQATISGHRLYLYEGNADIRVPVDAVSNP